MPTETDASTPAMAGFAVFLLARDAPEEILICARRGRCLIRVIPRCGQAVGDLAACLGRLGIDACVGSLDEDDASPYLWADLGAL